MINVGYSFHPGLAEIPAPDRSPEVVSSGRERNKWENISTKVKYWNRGTHPALSYCLEGESLIYCIISWDPLGAGISANPGWF